MITIAILGLIFKVYKLKKKGKVKKNVGNMGQHINGSISNTSRLCDILGDL